MFNFWKKKVKRHQVLVKNLNVVGKTDYCTVAVEPSRYYEIACSTRANGVEDRKGALLDINFLDKKKKQIDLKQCDQLSYSAKFGFYKYLPVVKVIERSKSFIKIPENVTYIQVALRCFKQVKNFTAENLSLSILGNIDQPPSEIYNKYFPRISSLYGSEKKQFSEFIQGSLSCEELTAVFDVLFQDGDYVKATEYGQKALDAGSDDFKLINKVSDSYRAIGCLTKSAKLRKILVERGIPNSERKYNKVQCEVDLYQKPFPFNEKKIEPTTSKKSLYLLHNSLPYHTAGYATRSHGLMKGVQLCGYEISACSRLGYPRDMRGLKELPDEIPLHEVIEGVDYHRVLEEGITHGSVDTVTYVNHYAEAIAALGREKDIAIYHGASNNVNGLAAVQAARLNGAKSVYEVRGLWELTRLSRDPEFVESEQYQMLCSLEAQACQEADKVICITKALAKIMVARGVPEEKITIVSNATHTNDFFPLERNNKLATTLGITPDDTVIGYIGSIVNYEGLDHLMESIHIMNERGLKNFKCLIVGDGAVWEGIKNQAKELNIEEIVIFAGRVPHEEVQDYYSLIDIAPFPRKPYEVCEAVSPIKPFEAMAMGKIVIASSCAALEEIVAHGETGIIFEKGSPIDLADKLYDLVINPENAIQLANNARKWVVENKDWKHVAKNIAKVYEELLGSEVETSGRV